MDDILAILHDPKLILKNLRDQYTLKKESIKGQDQYLRAQVCKWYVYNIEDPGKKQ